METIERVLRQLALALGESLENSSTETAIENKLSCWILPKIYNIKGKRIILRTVSKLGNFMWWTGNEQVRRQLTFIRLRQ